MDPTFDAEESDCVSKDESEGYNHKFQEKSYQRKADSVSKCLDVIRK